MHVTGRTRNQLEWPSSIHRRRDCSYFRALPEISAKAVLVATYDLALHVGEDWVSRRNGIEKYGMAALRVLTGAYIQQSGIRNMHKTKNIQILMELKTIVAASALRSATNNFI
jgi:hypothetical protein